MQEACVLDQAVSGCEVTGRRPRGPSETFEVENPVTLRWSSGPALVYEHLIDVTCLGWMLFRENSREP